MTASELKYQIESHGHEPYFFSRQTMKFFGDTMKNYGVVKTSIPVMNYESGQVETVEVYELYRKHPVKHGLKDSAYFRVDTFERVRMHKN